MFLFLYEPVLSPLTNYPLDLWRALGGGLRFSPPQSQTRAKVASRISCRNAGGKKGYIAADKLVNSEWKTAESFLQSEYKCRHLKFYKNTQRLWRYNIKRMPWVWLPRRKNSCFFTFIYGIGSCLFDCFNPKFWRCLAIKGYLSLSRLAKKQESGVYLKQPTGILAREEKGQKNAFSPPCQEF